MEVSYQKTEIALLDFELSIVNSSTTVTVFRNGFNKLGTLKNGVSLREEKLLNWLRNIHWIILLQWSE